MASIEHAVTRGERDAPRAVASPAVPADRREVGVLEVDPTGHRLQYVRHVHDAAGPGGCLVLVPAQVHASEEFAAHLGVDVPVATVGSFGERSGAIAPAVRVAEAHGVTRLVVTEADGHLVSLLLLLVRRPRLRMEFRLLLMRTVVPRGSESWRPALLVKPVLVAVLRRLRRVRVHFLSDAFGVVLHRPGFPGVVAVRDPIVVPRDESSPPEWFPPRRPDALLVGIFGVISPRKNVALLVRAARQAPRVTVVVAGQVEPEIASWLDRDDDADALRRAGRLVVVDRVLDPEEFGAALGAVDVVAVLHDNDAPSGIVAEACGRGTPALVPHRGWLARVAAATGVGWTTELTVPAVAETLRTLDPQEPTVRESLGRQRDRLGTEDFTSTLLAPR